MRNYPLGKQPTQFLVIWNVTEKLKEDMSARKLRGRQVTSMNARVAGNNGRAWDKAMRVGTGGSLVHTAERLQVEEQNDGRQCYSEKEEWKLRGWMGLSTSHSSVSLCSPSCKLLVTQQFCPT